MKRLRFFILIFCVALSIPVGYFVLRTYRSLEQEERAQLRFFAETIFAEMEREMAAIVRREEGRAVDEYNYRYVPETADADGGATIRSPLSRPPDAPYILGYFQNNPDGSFQTPLAENPEVPPTELTDAVSRLRRANAVFNGKRTTAAAHPAAPPTPAVREMQAVQQQQEQRSGFADRFLSRRQKEKVSLGQETKRVEEITVSQARNLAKVDRKVRAPAPSTEAKTEGYRTRDDPMADATADAWGPAAKDEDQARGVLAEAEESGFEASDFKGRGKLQAEVDPMQSVFLNGDGIFIFRRIAIGNRIYRQGFVLRPRPFLEHLADAHFAGQPMSRFTELRLAVAETRGAPVSARFGVDIDTPRFVVDRVFPRPFSFLRATLICETIPPSEGRSTLRIMIGVLSAIVLLGLLAIYQSARVVVDLSERRSRFVSSVTHELKTPLTSIRMYIEMLEQGMARTPEREADYYRVLGSETARLSRLINNVLEFSKLEKKQFRLEPVEGDFREVIDEVRRIMDAKLKKEGFELVVDYPESDPPVRFRYDREVMIQVLINLMENSMKFGKDGGERRITLRVRTEGGRVTIRVSDRGPGIPRHALKRVFDDFYRVDDERTRNTRGTGIGLAFVKKVIVLAGGTVRARNNGDGAGCSILLYLPFGK